jgi:uncharacterized membrane protein
MYVLPISLVLLSALLHVTWNVKLQATKDPLKTTTLAVIIGAVILAPIVLAYWVLHGTPAVSSGALVFGFFSGLAELGYFYFLSYSYEHGELSVVYPVARGSAPIMTFLFATLLLGEKVTLPQLLGIAGLIAGIWLIRSTQIHGKKGVIPALTTGIFIAAYTVIDKVGLGYADPVVFGGLKYFFTAACLVGFLLVQSRLTGKPLAASSGRTWKTAAFIGMCIIATYQLVLFAMSLAPVAIISPLRESASVVVTIWGIWKLKEHDGLVAKLIGVGSIFTGMILLVI